MDCCDADGAPTFVEADTPAGLHALLQTVITLAHEDAHAPRRADHVVDQSYPHAQGDESRPLRPLLAAAAVTCRIAFGPHAGQKVILSGAMPRGASARQPLCAGMDGNSAARRYHIQPKATVTSTKTQQEGTALEVRELMVVG